MAAIIPCRLMESYENMELQGKMYSIDRFTIEGTAYEYRRFEKYSFLRDEWEILLNKNTKLTPLPCDDEPNFPLFANVPSLRDIANERSGRKILTGTLFSLFNIYTTLLNFKDDMVSLT